jgi:hypothetical protein
MEMLVSFDLPISNSDLIAVQDILRQKDIIRTVYLESEFDQYSFIKYSEQIILHKTQFCAILDRNIFSDIIAIAQSKCKNPSETHKTACALLAFLQITGTLIEPGVAIYEYIDSGHYEYAENELLLFRAADNINPIYYVDIALGRSTTLPENILAVENKYTVKSLKGEDIPHWKLIYGLTLKMAILEIKGETNFNKVKSLLQWMYTDYMFISCNIAFAMIYFSNKRFSGMIKHLKKSGEKLKQGLRNATWDIYLVHYWSEKVLAQKKNNQIWLLCTEDKAVKEFSRNIIDDTDLQKYREISLYKKYLGEKEGQKAYEIYLSLIKNLDNSQRMINTKPKEGKIIDAIIAELKKELCII